jgi:glycosyltransferase involved in cell wall biosynthesis
MQVVVISSHPLSLSSRADISAYSKGEILYLPISTQKTKGMLGLIRYLVDLSARVTIIVIETPEDQIYFPVLALLSLLINARDTYLLTGNSTRVRLSKFGLVQSSIMLLLSHLHSFKAFLIARVQIRSLEKEPRPTFSLPIHFSRFAYLNTNLMVGVKAGGSLGHISGVVNEITRRGVDITYYASKSNSGVLASASFVKLKFPSVVAFPLDLFLFRYSQCSADYLSSALRDVEGIIIYQRLSRCDYAGAMLKRRLRVPLIVEYNGSEVWAARNWGSPLRFEKLAKEAELVMLRCADLVVTVSQPLADELVEIGVNRSRIICYPNCVDTTLFDPVLYDKNRVNDLRVSLNLSSQAFVYGFIGTFGAWHGIDFLCAAIRYLSYDSPDWLEGNGVRFLFVGDGLRRAAVESLLQDPVTARFVVWAGLVDQSEAPRYLAAMDVVLSPHVKNSDGSKFFGSPTKIFEYMSMGKPIIASRLDQIADVLTPSLDSASLPKGDPEPGSQELAVLYRPGNEAEFVEAIRFIRINGNWRLRLGENAQQEARHKYQWSHHVEKIFNRLSHSRPAS